jgi:DNA-binding GntR family transcriptional regulator
LTGGALAPISPAKTLTDQVGAAIRAAIVAGSLPAGSRITAPALARQLNVSPTPVREALRNLQEAGLVSFDSGALLVVAPNEKRIRDAYEAREALEGMAARLAALRRTERQSVKIVSLAEVSVNAALRADENEFMESDAAFHGAIAEAAGNNDLKRLTTNARDVASVLTRLRHQGMTFRADAAVMHTAIAEAIALGDADTADAAMRSHIADVLEQTIAGTPSSNGAEPAASARLSGRSRKKVDGPPAGS